MSSQILLSGGDKWFSYSGELFGDVSVPATIQTNLIPNTGLKDSYVVISPFYGAPISNSGGAQIGITIKLDNVEIVKHKVYDVRGDMVENFPLFIPRNSKLEIISDNSTANNTQTRGVTLIGYYL